MDTIFVNFKNSKTSEPQVLILNLTNRLEVRRGEKNADLSNLSTYYK